MKTMEMMTMTKEKFDRQKFEKDLISEILEVQDKLGKKYGIKFSIDVSWNISEGKEERKEHKDMPAM